MKASAAVLCILLSGRCLLRTVPAEVVNKDELDLPFDPNNLTITLFNPSREASKIIVGEPDTVRGFDRTSGLKVLIHGLSESDRAGWMVEMRNAFLENGFNVITVDWSLFSATWQFAYAMKYTVPVGKFVALAIDWLNSQFQIEDNGHHVIGFSLGAHVAAVVGYNMQNPKLARITGLDPSGPFMASRPLSERLDKSDAQFVDVIHTNAGNLLSGQLGYLDPLGHVDFYPNGGQQQPGCGAIFYSFLHGRLIPYANPSSTCSHSRAVKYYLESIKYTDGFRGFACASVTDFQTGKCLDVETSNLMGFYARSALQGTFYLPTRTESPYHAHEVFVNMTIAGSQNETGGGITIVLEGSGFAEERILLEKRKAIAAGNAISQMVGVSPDMRSIDNVTVKFERRTSTMAELLQVERIEIYNSRLHKRYCVGYFELLTDTSKSLPTSRC